MDNMDSNMVKGFRPYVSKCTVYSTGSLRTHTVDSYNIQRAHKI